VVKAALPISIADKKYGFLHPDFAIDRFGNYHLYESTFILESLSLFVMAVV